jgi:hypothetical protein
VTCSHVLDSSKSNDNKVKVRFKSDKKNYEASVISFGDKNLGNWVKSAPKFYLL